MYKEKIKDILKIVKGSYFDFEDNLITDGLISSFDLVKILNELEKRFGIKIPVGDFSPESFNSVSEICDIVEMLVKKG